MRTRRHAHSRRSQWLCPAFRVGAAIGPLQEAVRFTATRKSATPPTSIRRASGAQPQKPVCKTSIGGASGPWTTRESSALYYDGQKRFRIFTDPLGITVAKARARQWHIKRVAHPKGEMVLSGSKSCAGSSSPKAWKVSPYGKHAVYTDVKTGCKVAEGTPRYVTALSGKSSHYTNHGVSEPYTATADGFRIWMYSTAPIYPATAAKWDWKINWIAAGTVPRTPVPTPVPSFKRAIKGGGWAVSKGKCRIDARVPGRPCLMSPNFPGKYTAEETCTVDWRKKTFYAAFERFDTEMWFDVRRDGKFVDTESSSNCEG
mmetsp:Transcript_60248/g.116162  ORF Transcript_60248/g.116162 Transcript_60248/m.116162 type:complete len:316 (+) Transcript_60248:299-1246(+)